MQSTRIPVLWPPPEAGEMGTNDRSLVLQLGPARQALLATGDLEREGERGLLARLGASSAEFLVLKVAHHGGDTGSDPPLLRELDVDWALVSCGSGNRYGHPHPDVIRRLTEAGARTLRTDEAGALTVRWNRVQSGIEVESVRPAPLAGRPP